jgi:hypothetical protein
MGFIPSLLGLNGGGAGWQASGAGNQGTTAIQNPVTAEQVQSALAQQQNYLNQSAAQNGLGNQSQVYNQMQSLVPQLQALANGQGPNPAQAQLAQATAQNVANTAALQGGQRGGNANVGLLARQIGQQGANTQQQAAGQAATLGAQQQIAGIGALQNQQAALGNLAGTQAAQQQAALQQYAGNALSGIGEQNQANVSQQSNINNANANIQAGNQKAQSGLFSNVLGALGTAVAGPVGGLLGGVAGGKAAEGGLVGYADGGEVSEFSKYLAMDDTPAMSSGGNVNRDMRTGGKVPGKPKVGGAKDSYANDTVPAKLSPGEIVLPRSVTKSDDPAGNAAKFVAAVLANQRMRR